MAYLRRTPISPLHEDHTVMVEYLHVSDAARRHGLGKALIAEAVAWAEHESCAHLAVIAPVIAREANRFLARLGLGQAGVLRFATTHTVRRRLAAEHASNLLGSALVPAVRDRPPRTAQPPAAGRRAGDGRGRQLPGGAGISWHVIRAVQTRLSRSSVMTTSYDVVVRPR